MQPASDLFLGWATGPKERHLYMRQLRDAVKLSVLVETYNAELPSIYAIACGWVLRGVCEGRDPWMISGYLGRQDYSRRSDGEVCATIRRNGTTRRCRRRYAGIINVQMGSFEMMTRT